MERLARDFPSALPRLYGGWSRSLKDYSRIVVLDSCLLFSPSLLSFVRQRAQLAEIFLYSWNVSYTESEVLVMKRAAERNDVGCYSYDEHFCARYGFEFNTIMYDRGAGDPRPSSRHQDLIFLGYVKDRLPAALGIKGTCDEGGVRSRFVLVGDCPEMVGLPGVEMRSSYVEYTEYLGWVASSRAILDLAQSGQIGYSMRVMEAIFFGKKLISTNPKIESADFFSPENILHINPFDCSPSDIRRFLDAPTKPYPIRELDYYSVERWVERFVY